MKSLIVSLMVAVGLVFSAPAFAAETKAPAKVHVVKAPKKVVKTPKKVVKASPKKVVKAPKAHKPVAPKK